MSFIRPELAANLRRWREAILWSGVTALACWIAVRGFAGHAWIQAGAGLLLGGAGTGLALAAIRRTRFASAREAEGIVTLDEGQIGYFATHGGGFIDLATLAEVEIVTRARAGGPRAEWRLTPDAGQPLAIPMGARNAALVYDGLATLPGMDISAALAALSAQRPGRVRVWCRADGPTIGRVATIAGGP